METPEICKLPVPATPDAVLFLWVPGSCLPEAFEVLEAWRFSYVTNIVWIKNVVGLGNWVRNQHELLLIGRRGNMPCPLPANRPPSVIQAPRREHSQKPDAAYALIERMYPGLPKLELFARNIRPGWSAWGNEVQRQPNNGNSMRVVPRDCGSCPGCGGPGGADHAHGGP